MALQLLFQLLFIQLKTILALEKGFGCNFFTFKQTQGAVTEVVKVTSVSNVRFVIAVNVIAFNKDLLRF